MYDPKKELKKDKHRTVVRQAAEKPVGFFSHLPQNEKFINIQSHLKKQDDIHPTILTLGVKYSEFFITGANARCIALLSALERVITDYQAPEGASLSRTLASMISKQVDFLSNVRVLGTSMKTVIRQLKSEISVLPPDISDEDAKTRVCKFIQEFARNRIILAGDFIVQEAINQRKIVNGDVILVYAK